MANPRLAYCPGTEMTCKMRKSPQRRMSHYFSYRNKLMLWSVKIVRYDWSVSVNFDFFNEKVGGVTAKEGSYCERGDLLRLFSKVTGKKWLIKI